jgi:hypothetical protein
MPYLNSNHVIIRNSNTMDTVKLIDTLSKLGIIKKKKKKSGRKMEEAQSQMESTPFESAQRFLQSRPAINVKDNTGDDTAKRAEIERIRREAFGHMARVTDALERQREEQAQEPTRFQPIARIQRFENQQMANEDVDVPDALPDVNDAENQQMANEDVNIQGVNNDVVPNVKDADLRRVGPNDKVDEMVDDRNVTYPGEDGRGLVFDEEDDNGFVDETTRDIYGSEGEIQNVENKPSEGADIYEESQPGPRAVVGRENVAIINALRQLGLNNIARNKSDINNLTKNKVNELFQKLSEFNVDIVPAVSPNLARRKDALAQSLENFGLLLMNKND